MFSGERMGSHRRFPIQGGYFTCGLVSGKRMNYYLLMIHVLSIEMFRLHVTDGLPLSNA